MQRDIVSESCLSNVISNVNFCGLSQSLQENKAARLNWEDKHICKAENKKIKSNILLLQHLPSVLFRWKIFLNALKGKIYIWDQIILMFTAENFCSNVSLKRVSRYTLEHNSFSQYSIDFCCCSKVHSQQMLPLTTEVSTMMPV